MYDNDSFLHRTFANARMRNIQLLSQASLTMMQSLGAALSMMQTIGATAGAVPILSAHCDLTLTWCVLLALPCAVVWLRLPIAEDQQRTAWMVFGFRPFLLGVLL